MRTAGFRIWVSHVLGTYLFSKEPWAIFNRAATGKSCYPLEESIKAKQKMSEKRTKEKVEKQNAEQEKPKKLQTVSKTNQTTKQRNRKGISKNRNKQKPMLKLLNNLWVICYL